MREDDSVLSSLSSACVHSCHTNVSSITTEEEGRGGEEDDEERERANLVILKTISGASAAFGMQYFFLFNPLLF